MKAKLNLAIISGNLLGAVLTFLYFSYINVGIDNTQGEGLMFHHIVSFVLGTAFIFFVIVTIINRWSRPLYQAISGEIPLTDLDEVSLTRLKKKAL